MNNKKKGGKAKKQPQGDEKKSGGQGGNQKKDLMMAENPALGLANLQSELMGKISAMKETLLKGEGGEGLGKEMIDNLFKNLLGDLNMPSSNVDKKQYIETEESHQALLHEIDDTLSSILSLMVEIDVAYEKVIKGELEEFPIHEEKEQEYHLTPAEEALCEKEMK